MCIKKDCVKEIGLPCVDYFIQYDDTEYSLRVSALGKILCIPSAIVIHDIKEVNVNVDWKAFYGIRNRLMMIKKHFPKRYFIYEFLRIYFGSFFKKNINGINYRKMRRDAAVAALFNKLNKHKKYLP